MSPSPLKEATELKARYLPHHRSAIVWRDRRISWKELDERVDRLAAALHRLGITRGDNCALLFHNQPEFIEANLAVQALGAVPVPVNFRYVADELRYVLENSRAVCLLFHHNALPVVQGLGPRPAHLGALICQGASSLPEGILGYESLVEQSDGHYPHADVASEDTAVIIYTGGTTGRPKGVMLTYENFRANQEAILGFLVRLLPPVEELDLPVYATSEMQRKILGLLGDLTDSVSPVLYANRQTPPVILMEVVGDAASVHLPPLTVTLREGKPKLFAGAPPRHDFRIRMRMGDDFRKFIEMTYYQQTWKGKLKLLPELVRMARTGAFRTEGPLALRLRMSLANLTGVHARQPQNIFLVPPLFHLASYAFWLTFWLYRDGTVYLPPGPEWRTEEILDTVAQEEVAWLLLVPTMWKRCLKTLRDTERSFPSLRVALSGAAVLPARYKREILQHFPNALVLDGFGQTEMAPVTTVKVDAEPDTIRDRSVGSVLQGLELKIVDEQGEQVEDGTVGELCYRGPSVMKGYFQDPEKTREVLDLDGWFHSGDLAYRGADGEIYTVERKRECINSGGEKIFPQEVEEILAGHPAVEDVCVIGVPDDDLGESVRAVVVGRDAPELDPTELIEWCRGKMAGFKKPRSIVFAPDLPTSPVGKVLRARIKELYGQPGEDVEA